MITLPKYILHFDEYTNTCWADIITMHPDISGCLAGNTYEDLFEEINAKYKGKTYDEVQLDLINTAKEMNTIIDKADKE